MSTVNITAAEINKLRQMTGAGMMTAGAPIVPGLLASSTPTLMGGLGTLGGAAFNAAKDNPLQTLGLGMSAYDRMNQSQAPLQQSPMLSSQQLMGQQGPVPTPQFNSLLISSILLTPPPTVNGTKHILDVLSTTS